MPLNISGPNEGSRIVFLDYLRALAVMLVVWAHIFIVGVNNPDVIKIWLPSVSGNIFGSSIIFENIYGNLDLFSVVNFGVSSGPLGVAIFFLISGFVILRSVDSLPPGIFLIQRAFRIFPLCAVTVVSVAVFTYFHSDKTLSPHTIESVAASSFAASGFFMVMGTLPVLWSLTVEILFYVLMAVAVLIVGRIGFKTLVIMSCICVFAVWVFNTPLFAATMPSLLTYELVYISSMLVHVIFMLVGSALYRGFSTSRMGASAICAAVVFGFYLLAFAIYKSLRENAGIGTTSADAITAIGIFLLAFWAGLTWRWLRPLKFVADISYPLYLIHVPLGWALLIWLGSLGWNYHWAALISTTAIALLAWMLHIFIETPSQRFGKFVSRRGRKKIVSTPQPLASGNNAPSAALNHQPGL